MRVIIISVLFFALHNDGFSTTGSQVITTNHEGFELAFGSLEHALKNICKKEVEPPYKSHKNLNLAPIPINSLEEVDPHYVPDVETKASLEKFKDNEYHFDSYEFKNKCGLFNILNNRDDTEEGLIYILYHLQIKIINEYSKFMPDEDDVNDKFKKIYGGNAIEFKVTYICPCGNSPDMSYLAPQLYIRQGRRTDSRDHQLEEERE
jgi:hypothetical protein